MYLSSCLWTAVSVYCCSFEAKVLKDVKPYPINVKFLGTLAPIDLKREHLRSFRCPVAGEKRFNGK
jgi:hypothetical protein